MSNQYCNHSKNSQVRFFIQGKEVCEDCYIAQTIHPTEAKRFTTGQIAPIATGQIAPKNTIPDDYDNNI